MATTNNIVILTVHHSISGQVVLDQRLSDFMNDRQFLTMTLLKTQIARLNDPSKVLEQHDESVIPKNWAVVIFEPPQKETAAANRIYSYVPKRRQKVFLVMEGMEVRGMLHTAGELDLRRLLATTSDSFIPITDAVVTLYDNDRFLIEQNAIMVNARLIRYIGTMS
jgi:hypothetical protein